ncbi:hypothetical protein [Leptospira stimsonii]|uniref:Uncharacterized protein n=1 Tax=Leptospira stimsonii TaxID=2202203 RepID=A0ABY2N5J7_9LEPT|nr:hypothetical protein [Leptospira stimsonii]TGK12802.1 hypothetical protein EHO98_19370 [Leptospira stimsonii]TGM17451.1 hypothetical protein EHQ90_07020 [Leptospira stimsonii]
MAYQIFEGAIYGHGEKSGTEIGDGSVYGTSCKGEPTQATIFIEFTGGPDEDSQVQFSSASGSLVARFPLGIKYPLPSDLKLVVDENGPKSAELKLTNRPDFPLPDFATFKARVDGRDIYKGYFYETPDQMQKVKDGLTFKNLGMRKRLEEIDIKNNRRWNIHEIYVTGSTGTDAIIFLGANEVFPQNLDTGSIEIGQKIRVNETEDSKNEGLFEVLEILDELTLRIHNPSVLPQTVIKGWVEIFPKEWGNPLTPISDLVSQVFSEYGQEIPVFFSQNLIQNTIGRATLGELYLNGMTLWKFVDLAQNMLGGLWIAGVDGNGYYFLKERRAEPIDKLNVGFAFNDVDFKRDISGIWNYIQLFVKDPDGSGSKFLTYIEDPTSRAKWGKKMPPGGGIEVPASMTKEVGDLYLAGILAKRKDPKYIITINNAPFKYYEFGDYIVPTVPGDYTETLEDMDSLSGFVISDPTKLAVFADTKDFTTGYASHKLVLSNADGVTYRKTVNKKVFSLKKIKFQVKANEQDNWVTNPGGFIRFGLGKTSFLEHDLIAVPIGRKDGWDKFEVDVSKMKLDFIGEIGWKFFNPPDCIVWLDHVEIFSYTTLEFIVPLKEVEYNFKKRFCKLTFGSTDNRFEKYLVGYTTQIETQKIMMRNN